MILKHSLFLENAPQLILNSFLKFRENMKKMFLEKINLPSAFLSDMVTNNPFLKKLLRLLTSHNQKNSATSIVFLIILYAIYFSICFFMTYLSPQYFIYNFYTQAVSSRYSSKRLIRQMMQQIYWKTLRQ